jgi:hypothetical protein
MKVTVLYKKAAAALLLLVLLLTTFVQVTHSHVTKSSFAERLKKAVTINETVAIQSNDANCFICDYQLAKDADNFFACATAVAINNFLSADDAYIIAALLQDLTHFETRGPPSFFTAA